MSKLFSIASVVALSVITLTAHSVQAQVAEVPAANAKGDFTTARVMGNRGYYRNTHWLVVDSGRFLNCRATPNGAVRSRLLTGWVVKAVFPAKDADAIVLIQGSSWLRILPQDPSGRPASGECFVRANSRYVAPISEDFIPQGGLQAGK